MAPRVALRYGGGLTSAELGEVLDKADPEIERILQCARAHLRQSLVEAGCRFISQGSHSRSLDR